jgi:hypothetical protein
VRPPGANEVLGHRAAPVLLQRSPPRERRVCRDRRALLVQIGPPSWSAGGNRTRRQPTHNDETTKTKPRNQNRGSQRLRVGPLTRPESAALGVEADRKRTRVAARNCPSACASAPMGRPDAVPRQEVCARAFSRNATAGSCSSRLLAGTRDAYARLGVPADGVALLRLVRGRRLWTARGHAHIRRKRSVDDGLEGRLAVSQHGFYRALLSRGRRT